MIDCFREQILHSFSLEKPIGVKRIFGRQTKQFEKSGKSVLKNNTIYLEDVGRDNIYLNGEIITFNLILIEK